MHSLYNRIKYSKWSYCEVIRLTQLASHFASSLDYSYPLLSTFSYTTLIDATTGCSATSSSTFMIRWISVLRFSAFIPELCDKDNTVFSRLFGDRRTISLVLIGCCRLIVYVHRYDCIDSRSKRKLQTNLKSCHQVSRSPHDILFQKNFVFLYCCSSKNATVRGYLNAFDKILSFLRLCLEISLQTGKDASVRLLAARFKQNNNVGGVISCHPSAWNASWWFGFTDTRRFCKVS